MTNGAEIMTPAKQNLDDARVALMIATLRIRQMLRRYQQENENNG